jgi:fumarate hydratase subunit beta
VSAEPLRVETPFTAELARSLRAGGRLLLSGPVLVARDAAHRRMVELLAAGRGLPFDLAGQLVYYAGPTPARPGKAVGSMGPTTSGRMDPYVEPLLAAGLRGMIGKGERSAEVKLLLVKHGAVYLAATGGAGALLGERIKAAEVLAWPELGPEAVLRVRFEDFPVLVACDTVGGDLYKEGREAWRRP